MLVERTAYFAKPGLAARVLETRRRASAVRLALGLPAGTIFVAHGESDAPDVSWECRFRDAEEHRRDLALRDGSEAFAAVRRRMQELIARFERHVVRQVTPEPIDLSRTSLAPERTTFRAGEAELTGFLYRPPGDGPHPAIVLNHGSGVTQGSADVAKPAVASVLVGWGIAVLFPNRWGYGESPGRYWRDEVSSPFGTAAYDRELVRRLHRESRDVIDARAHLESLDGVDGSRIGVMGSSFGGTVSLLAAAKCDRFRCAVDFAGAAMNWERTPKLRELMKQSARALEMPVFVIQAENDYSTAPTEELARTLARHGKAHEARIYPPFGASAADGHAFERAGAAVWGDDVRRFLERHL